MTLTTAEVLNAERARVKALIDKDIETLSGLLSEKLTYTHSNGHIDNKTQVVDKLRTTFRYVNITRGELKVELFGDIAVTTGPMDVEFISDKDPEEKVQAMAAIVTQVWNRTDTGPQMVAYHVSKKA